MQWKPNTTVAAIVERDNRFLLVEEQIDGRLVFNQAAGHLEHGETLIAAVKREVLEETAWEFEPKYLVGIYLYPNPNQANISYMRFCFYGVCTDWHEGRALDVGIVQAVWLTRKEIVQQQQRLRSPMVLRCIDDYLNGAHYPLDLLRHD